MNFLKIVIDDYSGKIKEKENSLNIIKTNRLSTPKNTEPLFTRG